MLFRSGKDDWGDAAIDHAGAHECIRKDEEEGGEGEPKNFRASAELAV